MIVVVDRTRMAASASRYNRIIHYIVLTRLVCGPLPTLGPWDAWTLAQKEKRKVQVLENDVINPNVVNIQKMVIGINKRRYVM